MNSPFAHDQDASLNELVERIKGFDHRNAAPSEQADFIEALQLVANEIVTRWGMVAALEADLRSKITAADLRVQLAKVLKITEQGNDTVLMPAQLGVSRNDGFFTRLKTR